MKNYELQVEGVSSVQSNWEKVERSLREAAIPFHERVAVRPGSVFPGAVLLVGQGGEILFEKYVGCRSLFPDFSELTEDMVFDVASLTKVLVTTTLVMQLVEQERLTVDRRLSRVFQTFGTHGKETMTIQHLLTHTSGYPATAPYYKYVATADSNGRAGVMTSRSASDMVYNEIFRARLENLPGRVTKYSDIGFILLGHAIELLMGTTLDKLALRHIFQPLGLKSTGYIDLSTIRRRGLEPVTEMIVPTARCPWRGKILCGEVHDDNAWAMGGVAAHAGIFSTAKDVHRFAAEMIDCYHGRSDFIHPEIVRGFWQVQKVDPNSSWALGWDTPSKTGSSSGRFLSPGSVGHLGFTGCSLWIDPERELDIILLSNRIHPSVDNNLIRDFRPVIHDLIMEALGYTK